MVDSLSYSVTAALLGTTGQGLPLSEHSSIDYLLLR